MDTRYLARGEIGFWANFWRVVMLLGVVAGVVLFFLADPIAGGFVAVPSFFILVCLEWWAALQRGKRLWITVQPDSFLIQDRRGERTYRDVQVSAVAYSVKNVFNEGKPAGFKRDAKLWLANESEPVIFENRIKEGKIDPLAEFLKRVMEILSAGFSQGLEQGLRLEGDGWTLSNLELAYTQRGSTQSMRIEDIAAVEDHDGKMGIWRRGEELPTAQFPVDGKNVWLLRNVLTPRLKKDGEEAQGAGMGRVLFERNAKKGWVIFMGLIAVVPVGIGALLLAKEPVGSAVAIVIGLLIATLVFLYSRTKFRCHERGVYKHGYFSDGRLLYNDVRAFTYSATRHYHNGAYVGTYLKFRFDAVSPEAGKNIEYHTSVSGGDDELDRLRNDISAVIAARMAKELAAGKRTQWTPNIAFLKEGFEFKPAGFFGRKDPVLLPYENYGGSSMTAGQFHLFEKGNSKAVMTLAVSEVNFFPGWFLLHMLFR